MIGNERSDTAQRVRALSSTCGRYNILQEGLSRQEIVIDCMNNIAYGFTLEIAT